MESLALPLPRIIAQTALSRILHRYIVGRVFHRYFLAVPADSAALRDEVYRIRYDVYCDELGWENPSTFPDGRERDAFDPYSLHSLLLHRPSNTYAGCVRLVKVNPEKPDDLLPFERLCAGRLYKDVIDTARLDRLRIGEISRLAVRARFRRRPGEHETAEGKLPEQSRERERKTPPIAMGLYLAAAASGLITGMEGVFALMEPRLARRLIGYGIAFRQVGDPVEHRGLRAPFYIDRPALYGGLQPVLRGFLEVIEGDLSSARDWCPEASSGEPLAGERAPA